MPAFRGSFEEYRRFVQLAANDITDEHQQGGEQERQTPTPVEQLVFGQQCGQQESDMSEEGAGGRAHLWDGGVETTLLRRRVLECHEYGSAPLAADGEALDES